MKGYEGLRRFADRTDDPLALEARNLLAELEKAYEAIRLLTELNRQQAERSTMGGLPGRPSPVVNVDPRTGQAS